MNEHDGSPGPVAGRLGSFPSKYQVIGSLGRGGMADVYLALVRGPGGFQKLVVLKRLRASFADDPAFQSMFLEEARLAARLNHPNVVTTFEVGECVGGFFMAMEYLEGQPLSRLLREAGRAGKPLGAPLSARIVADGLAGLHHAHTLRDYDGSPLAIVHRDVSPQNVFVTYDGQTKIVDFGIAKARSSSTHTDVGILKGKAAYMAPERAIGDSVDARADIFAMGVVLWEMLTGRRMAEGESPMATMHRIVAERIPRVSESRPNVDPELDRIVARALAKDRDERYASAFAMQQALEGYLARVPARRDDIGALVRELFGELKERVETQVRAFARASFLPPPPPDGTESPASLDGIVRIETGSESIARSQALSVPRSPAAAFEVVDLTGDGPPRPHAESQSAHAPRKNSDELPDTSVEGRALKLRKRSLRVVAVAAVAVAVVALGFFGASVGHGGPLDAQAIRTDVSHTRSVEAEHEVILRLCGSNTIGADLAPALAEAFLRRGGSRDVARAPLNGVEGALVLAAAEAGAVREAIEVRAEGTATAFSGLLSGTCDIGLASRRVKADEQTRLEQAGLGDFTKPGSEHVIALDGVAVIAHPNNPLNALELEQVRALFTGDVVDYAKVGGPSLPVVLYARDDRSGTYDTFRHVALRDRPLSLPARRFSASDELADAVASDESALGFVGLAYVRNAKALALHDQGSRSVLPSHFTVSTEDYPLSRRLYAYTPARPKNARTQPFISFALSPEGQAIVERAGFVGLGITMRPIERCATGCSARYAAVASTFHRLSLSFRFRSASTDLDTRAVRDLDRLVTFLRPLPGANVALLGFSDANGDAAFNRALSLERAKKVDEELAARGVRAATVEGFGAEMPVASNTTDDGRERNRRVEVWVKVER